MAAKPIVAATDGSEESLRAVDWAAREAVLRGAPLRIVSATALPPRMASNAAPEQYDTVSDVIRHGRDQGLAAAAERAKMAPGLLIDTDVLAGAPAQAVVDSGSGALMLVLGSRGVGAFTAMVLGSVSRYAASHAPCPVVVVRDEPPAARGLIGIGAGSLEDCADPLAFALEEASLRKASLTVVHAWHMPQADVSRAGDAFTTPDPHAVAAEAAGQFDGLLGDCRTRYPDVPVTQEVVHGHPARALVGLSARADLVIVGRRGKHSGLEGPGSVRHALLNHAHGPVAVVPSG